MATMTMAAGCATSCSPSTTGLRLDADTHTYYYDGRRVPGVTTSLTAAGLIDYSGIPQHVLDRAAERGSAVHRALEFFDAGTLDRSTVSDELEPYLQAYERFRADTGFFPVLSERSRYHPLRRYAGTFDRTGTIGDELILLDFKTVCEVQEGHMMQLAGYLHFFPSPRRFRPIALQLRPDAKYRVHEMRPCHFDQYSSVFFAAITMAHARIAQGRVH